jgi:hypothetical protein
VAYDSYLTPESIAPAKWCLRGSVATPAHLLLTRHSLTLVRPFGNLSSRIMSAMIAKSIVPRVEIDTSDGRVTLTNAKIVNVAPSHRFGPPTGHSEGSHCNEIEEFDLVFQKITFPNVFKSKSMKDDWISQT